MSLGQGRPPQGLGPSPEERLQDVGEVSGCEVSQVWAVNSCVTLAQTHSLALRFPRQRQRLLSVPRLRS